MSVFIVPNGLYNMNGLVLKQFHVYITWFVIVITSDVLLLCLSSLYYQEISSYINFLIHICKYILCILFNIKFNKKKRFKKPLLKLLNKCWSDEPFDISSISF